MRLNNLEIDLLRAFVEVAYTRSFTRAANRLGRVQSAVSNQIKRLEDLTGVKLIERNRRSVKPTKEGEVLLEYAERILRLNDAALSDLGLGEPAQRLRIGVADSASYFLIMALAKFARVHPKVQIDIRCERSWKVIESLESGELDLALVLQEPNMSADGLIRHEPLIWATIEDCDAPSQRPLPLALFGPGCALRTAGISALDRVSRPWRIAYNSPCRDGLLIAVRAGLAVTVAAKSTLEHGLVPVEPKYGLPPLPDMAIVLKESERALSKAGHALSGIIRETVKDSHPAPHYLTMAAG